MNNSPNFIVGKERFSALTLIDKTVNDPEVQRLINAVRLNDKTYEAHEPLEEDIVTSNDKWSCHIAEELGVIFEFTNGVLCLVSLRRDCLDRVSFESPSADIVCAGVALQYEIIEIAFGSRRIFSDDQLIPNRYSPIIGALLLTLVES